MTDSSAVKVLPGDTPLAELALRRLAMVAVLAVGLGFAIQGLILAVKLSGGAPFVGAAFLVDLAQGVTWSFVVCTGVGIATAVGKARAILAGMIALVFAPIAVALAKAAQKVMATATGAATNPAVLSLATISILRAVEYGALGWLLAKLTERDTSRSWPFLLVGAAIGVVFGGAITVLTYNATVLATGGPPTSTQAWATIVNEIGSPIGCAMLIYVAQFVGRNLKAIAGQD